MTPQTLAEGTPGRRDPYLARLAVGSMRTPASPQAGKKSLNELLTGHFREPVVTAGRGRQSMAVGHHGQAWRLMRQVEQQSKELDGISRELDEIDNRI